jgi:hypothetical protein
MGWLNINNLYIGVVSTIFLSRFVPQIASGIDNLSYRHARFVP